MDHTRGAPRHPQTQGKIERWHQTLKNRILLENYYLPGALEEAVAAFIDHYNHHRYHESLGNLIRTRAPLAFLSPRIQIATLDGTLPPEITVKRLMSGPLPLDWSDQSRRVGI